MIGDGQSAVASNIANTTYRLQWWDFTKFDLPEISNGKLERIPLLSFKSSWSYHKHYDLWKVVICCRALLDCLVAVGTVKCLAFWES